MAWKQSRRDFIGHAQKVALATPFLSLAGCGEETVDDLISFAGQTMGTTYSVKLVDTKEGVDAEALAGRVDDALGLVNERMSTYLASSELSRFNDAEPGRWMPISEDTVTVIDESRRLSAMTDGAFDPTVGPIVDLWGFGPDGGQERVPSAATIAAMAERVGFDRVELRDDRAAIRKSAPGVRLDFSGVAKGFGVDRVAEQLEAVGVRHYLVEVGGELRASGRRPDGQPWRVGIEKPLFASVGVQQIVDLDGETLATSGNYRIFFEKDGQRYSHIVNPRTGRPLEHDLASVSVIAPTTLEADALSTSLLVLGAEDGMAFAAKHDVQAFFISGSEGAFEETASPAFSARRPA
ncbi:MAG: FAD:protein FMN transferase [Pseudomonadota bacterium]